MDQQLQVIEQVAAVLANPDQRAALEQAARELRQGEDAQTGLAAAIADAERVTKTPSGGGGAAGVGSSQPDVLWARALALAVAERGRPIEGELLEIGPAPTLDSDTLGAAFGLAVAPLLEGLGPLLHKIAQAYAEKLDELVDQINTVAQHVEAIAEKPPVVVQQGEPAKASAKPRTARSG